MSALQNTDPEVFQAVQNEQTRQREGLELIASENYTWGAVLGAVGTKLNNEYAEGCRALVGVMVPEPRMVRCMCEYYANQAQLVHTKALTYLSHSPILSHTCHGSFHLR